MAVQRCAYLQQGDAGPEVRALQQAINSWLLLDASARLESCQERVRPALLAEDGVFGPLTQQAVFWVQCRAALPQDGLAGFQTLTALQQVLSAAGMGIVSFGSGECVTPVTYEATDAANQYRIQAGLPPLPVPRKGDDTRPSPRTGATRWAVAIGGVLAWRWLQRRKRR